MEAAEQTGVSDERKGELSNRTLKGKGKDREASGAALLRE